MAEDNSFICSSTELFIDISKNLPCILAHSFLELRFKLFAYSEKD